MKIYQKINRNAKLLLLLLLVPFSVVAEFDDWITTESCRQDANKLCHGYYRQPIFPIHDPAKGSENKQPVTITSDEANFVAKGTSVFSGNVAAKQTNKFIFANQAQVTHDAKSGELEKISAQGNVRIMQPDIRVDGSKATAYVAEDRKVVDDAVYRIYNRHGRGTAETLTIEGNSIMKLNDCTYTTCAPGNNAWYLKASDTEFNRETGRGEAWNARLYVKDVPVFYWPYVNVPIDKRRQSGFLQPSFESSSLNGRTVVAPFYWNLAPNYDATITTNYMSKRGFKFDNKFRYLTRNSVGNINFDFLPQDRAYRELRQEQYANNGFMNAVDSATVLRRNDLRNKNYRYKFFIKNTTNLTDNLAFNLDYMDASDGNYLFDFYNDEFNYSKDQWFTVYALQRANLAYGNNLGSMKLQVEKYKTFHVINGPSGVQQLSKLPELSLNSANFQLPKGFTWNANANMARFRPAVIPGNDVSLSYGQRYQIRPSLSYPINEPGWFIIPRVQVNHLQYTGVQVSAQDRASGVQSGSPSITMPIYDVKSGLIYERNMRFKQTDFVQTLEPQLYYLYVPERNQNYLPNFDSGRINFDYNQVFRDNRYTGLDRVAEANQLGMGIATKFYNDDSGEEQGMIGIGRIRYFRKLVLRLNETNNFSEYWSPLAMVAKLRLSSEYSLEANLVRQKHYTNTASLQLQYRMSPTKVINLGYEYIRDPEPDLLTGKLDSDIKQIVLSSAWKFTPSMRLLGRLNYDLRFKRDLDALAGFEYHTCCTAIRFIWARDWMANIYNLREHSYKFRLQIIFKGFTGVGNADDSYVSQKISGYSSAGNF